MKKQVIDNYNEDFIARICKENNMSTIVFQEAVEAFELGFKISSIIDKGINGKDFLYSITRY